MNPKPYPEADSIPREKLKVSESFASYVISPPAATAAVAAKSRCIAGLEASDEVWEFAQRHRLAPHVETAVRLVKESFCDIRNTYLTFEPDPEIPNLDGIAINVKAGGTLNELVQQDQAFAQRFVQELSGDIRSKISLFVGGV